MTFTNCNKFILPQGRSEDGGLTKETQSVAKEGDDTKVEIKTVSEIPHCWWVSRNSRQQMVPAKHVAALSWNGTWVPTLKTNTLVTTKLRNATKMTLMNSNRLFIIFNIYFFLTLLLFCPSAIEISWKSSGYSLIKLHFCRQLKKQNHSDDTVTYTYAPVFDGESCALQLPVCFFKTARM